MRLVTFLRLGEPRLGAVVGGQVIDLNAGYQYLQERAGIPRARERAAVVLPPDMIGFLTHPRRAELPRPCRGSRDENSYGAYTFLKVPVGRDRPWRGDSHAESVDTN